MSSNLWINYPFPIKQQACESENDTALSCNNVALEFDGNEGNNVAGQE